MKDFFLNFFLKKNCPSAAVPFWQPPSAEIYGGQCPPFEAAEEKRLVSASRRYMKMENDGL